MTNEFSILVVDDDPVIRTLLDKYLSSTHTVYCAENGARALELLSQQQDIDLMFSDIEMPEMDGISLLDQVRTNYPEVGVIMISGSANTETAITAIRNGAYDYISKPFGELEEINIIIERWWKQQSLESKLAQYAMLHREMMHNMKTRTFLAVDVAGSGQLKQGEDPFIVQFVFNAYQDFIESIVTKHHGTVHSTSGDGTMACFEQAENAVAAASQILSDLDKFNSDQNQLANDFHLRTGAHTGQVVLNSDGQINLMFAESLDITGHIQKNASVNSLSISEQTVRKLSNQTSFKSTDKEVDGILLFEMCATI